MFKNFGALKILLGLFLSILAGALLSCSPPITNVFGELTLEIGIPAGVKTLTPAADLTISSYSISGTGPSQSTFSSTASGSSMTVSGLIQGTWTITADGKNAGGTVIVHGTASVTVTAGVTQTASIAVYPVSGPGTLSLTVKWPAADVLSPTIQAQLISATGSPMDLAFSTPSNGSATYSNSAITNGYYTLVIKLLDNGVLVMGAVDVAQIVAGQTTSGTYQFTAVNGAKGSITVDITPVPSDPLTVSMSGVPAAAVPGSPLTAAAVVSGTTSNVTCVWYLNGVSMATGSAISLNTSDNPLSLGTYRLDLTAFTADGQRAGSATASFTVGSEASVTLAWDANTEADLAGYKLYVGTASAVYGAPTTVGLVTETTVPNLVSKQTYYFSLTAFNTSGLESNKCAEISWTAP